MHRGDIAVFRYPLDIRQNYVKRVIGLAGDRIHMEDGVVIRNGVRLAEPYVQHLAVPPDFYRDNFPVQPVAGLPAEAVSMLRDNTRDGELVVPEGHYFMMGDNRDNSSDSRYWGLVARDNIIGKPVIVYWSYDAPTEDLLDYNIHHAVDLALHFFTKTRWSRTMRVIRP